MESIISISFYCHGRIFFSFFVPRVWVPFSQEWKLPREQEHSFFVVTRRLHNALKTCLESVRGKREGRMGERKRGREGRDERGRKEGREEREK